MECTNCRPSELEIHQGDVFAAHPSSPVWADRWARFCIVLSADCDIAQEKTDTGLVVVPVVGLRTYVVDIWAPTQLDKLMQTGNERLEPLLNRFAGKKISAADALNATPEEFAADLAARCGGDSELGLIVEKARLIHGALKRVASLRADFFSGPLSRQLADIYEQKKIITGNDLKPESDLENALKALTDSRRSDTWPLCDIIGLDGDMREDENHGFVAYLRRFRSVPTERVYTNKSLWLKDPSGYYRVCRLQGAYKSDIVQKFANLFSRVGLDDERDKEHKRVAERAAKYFLREENE